jgi:hypothetical protein
VLVELFYGRIGLDDALERIARDTDGEF